MTLIGVMYIYMYYILWDFGLFIFKTDCFIEVVPTTILIAADHSYELVSIPPALSQFYDRRQSDPRYVNMPRLGERT